MTVLGPAGRAPGVRLALCGLGSITALIRFTPTTEGSLAQAVLVVTGGAFPDGHGTVKSIQQFAINASGTVLVTLLDDQYTQTLYRDREPLLQSGLPVASLGLLDRIDGPDLNAAGAWVVGGETVDASGFRTDVLFKNGELYRAAGDRLASIGGLPLVEDRWMAARGSRSSLDYRVSDERF